MAASRVRDIQRAVRVWGQDPAAKKKLLCTARPNWLSLSTTFFRKDQCHRIPVPLYDILSVDEANMTVRFAPVHSSSVSLIVASLLYETLRGASAAGWSRW